MDEVVSELGFSPDPEKNSAIHNIPTPACKQDLQRCFGMINYLSKCIPNMSELTAPLWSLLNGDISWVWFAEHDSALTKINTVWVVPLFYVSMTPAYQPHFKLMLAKMA